MAAHARAVTSGAVLFRDQVNENVNVHQMRQEHQRHKDCGATAWQFKSGDKATAGA